MKTNFEVIDNHALESAARYIDLHNNFDFVGIEYNFAKREVRLEWGKSPESWVDINEPSKLVFIHQEVSFLRIIEQEENSSIIDATCLGELTFFPSTSRSINSEIVSQRKPNLEDDILYFFENGSLIRIHCEQINLSLIEDST